MTDGSLASNRNSKFVLDAWPVMEWFRNRKPAADSFLQLVSLAQSGATTLLISRINLGEAYYRIAKDFSTAHAEKFLIEMAVFPIQTISVSDAQVDAAYRLKARYSISYADSFAAALSIAQQAPLATGDPEFRALETDGLLQLHWLGA